MMQELINRNYLIYKNPFINLLLLLLRRDDFYEIAKKNYLRNRIFLQYLRQWYATLAVKDDFQLLPVADVHADKAARETAKATLILAHV